MNLLLILMLLPIVFVFFQLGVIWYYTTICDFTKKHKFKTKIWIIALMIVATSYIILISQLKDKF